MRAFIVWVVLMTVHLVTVQNYDNPPKVLTTQSLSYVCCSTKDCICPYNWPQRHCNVPLAYSHTHTPILSHQSPTVCFASPLGSTCSSLTWYLSLTFKDLQSSRTDWATWQKNSCLFLKCWQPWRWIESLVHHACRGHPGEDQLGREAPTGCRGYPE